MGPGRIDGAILSRFRQCGAKVIKVIEFDTPPIDRLGQGEPAGNTKRGGSIGELMVALIARFDTPLVGKVDGAPP